MKKAMEWFERTKLKIGLYSLFVGVFVYWIASVRVYNMDYT